MRVIATIGTFFLIVMFMLLGIEGDNFIAEELFTIYLTPISLLLAISASFITTMAL